MGQDKDIGERLVIVETILIEVRDLLHQQVGYIRDVEEDVARLELKHTEDISKIWVALESSRSRSRVFTWIIGILMSAVIVSLVDLFIKRFGG